MQNSNSISIPTTDYMIELYFSIMKTILNENNINKN